jgi:hypothetical protein
MQRGLTRKNSWFLGWAGVNFSLSGDVKKRSQRWVGGRGEEMAFFCKRILGDLRYRGDSWSGANYGGSRRFEKTNPSAGHWGGLKKRTQWRAGAQGVWLSTSCVAGPSLRMKRVTQATALACCGALRILSCQIAGGQCFEHLAARRDWHGPRTYFRGREVLRRFLCRRGLAYL